MFMLKPKRTFESVVEELAEGLANGTITVADRRLPQATTLTGQALSSNSASPVPQNGETSKNISDAARILHSSTAS